MSRAWLALNAVNGMGPVRIKKLIERFGSPEEIFAQTPDVVSAEKIVSGGCISQIFDPELFQLADKQMELAQSMGVEIMTLDDSDYPFYLKEIYAPPPVLYIKGKRQIFNKHAVGIVGTRNPTTYGKFAASSITRELVDCKLVIVSGLARGIDTVAHESCVQKNGFTIAVLGCGIDYIYPKTNEKLAQQICENGALVSEFPLGTIPDAFNFPRRNRIISGLGAGVVVVEAGLKSGSLITAHYALQQGREVFAVPGPINSPVSIGTFNLIRDGATPARSGKEIAESLRLVTCNELTTKNVQNSVRIPDAILSEDESTIYNLLSSEPSGIDNLSEKSGCAIGMLLCILLNLELKGLITQVSGQMFIRN
jgi:DNA processing protein